MGVVKKALMSDRMAKKYPLAFEIMKIDSHCKSGLVFSIVQHFCKSNNFAPENEEDVKWAVKCIEKGRIDLINSPPTSLNAGVSENDLERIRYEQFLLLARAEGSSYKDVSFDEWRGLSNGRPVKEEIISETPFSSLPVSKSSSEQETAKRAEERAEERPKESAKPDLVTEAVGVSVKESAPSFETVRKEEADDTKSKTQALMRMFDDDDDEEEPR